MNSIEKTTGFPSFCAPDRKICRRVVSALQYMRMKVHYYIFYHASRIQKEVVLFILLRIFFVNVDKYKLFLPSKMFMPLFYDSVTQIDISLHKLRLFDTNQELKILKGFRMNFQCDEYNFRISQNAFSEFALRLEGNG